MKTYIQPSATQGKDFFNTFKGKGSFVMLNLIRFKDKADYSTELEILRTGEEAYELYLKNISSSLKEIGSEVLFKGKASSFLVGPLEEEWDVAVLVKHQSVEKFMSFSQNKVYLENVKHQTAAIEDFRLLPLE